MRVRSAAGRGSTPDDLGASLLKTVVNAGMPVLVFFAIVVGMELTIDDFRWVARQPGIVVAAIVGQFLLPLITGWLSCAASAFNLPSRRGVAGRGVRNVGIATALAVTVVGRGEFVVCATASFLAQVPILLAAVVVSDADGSLTEAMLQEWTTHESPRCTIRESAYRPGYAWHEFRGCSPLSSLD